MTDFSIVSSILSSSDIASFVRDKYSLAASTTCKFLKTGINHTNRIDSENESFIFRIYNYNWRTKEEIVEELNLLKLLMKNCIPVSYPITDNSENFIQTIKVPEG
ncbi:MAG: hypothetical protein ABI315_01000 [Bacteroidia bacterium]